MTKHWEAELEALKGNNAKLTAALLESTANVKQWKQQLAAYQEEAERLHKRVRGQRVSFLCTLNEFNQRRGAIWKGRTMWRQDERVARNNRLILAPCGGIVALMTARLRLGVWSRMDLSLHQICCRFLGFFQVTELECQSNQTPVIKSQKTELNQTIEELENTLRDKEEVCARVFCERSLPLY